MGTWGLSRVSLCRFVVEYEYRGMHQIQLSEQLYIDVKRLAIAGGFRTVDEYVADVMTRRIHEEAGDFDHRLRLKSVPT
jgi:hypothetical protein